MKGQFYKIVPVQAGTKKQKSLYFWKDEIINKEQIDLLKVIHSDRYINGIDRIEIADINDADFINYLKSDLNKVREDITKLDKLEKNILSYIDKL